ncbi:DUF4427 domain-containing protein [Stenotrophomonas hibiscicola]
MLTINKDDWDYTLKNNIRFDLSNYLIHFFRDIDMESSNAIVLPEHMGWPTIIEGQSIPAILMLRSVLRNGRLWATWSFRNGIRTIYGPHPAVCMTEMPIAAFIEASRTRHARGEAMGEVALVFPKSRMRSLGARPVIYGLSRELSILPKSNAWSPRLLPSEALPFAEQYRYVTDGSSVDWTHEREWRWPCRVPDYLATDDSVRTWYDIPGLNVYEENIVGMGAIVKTRAHANLIISDMVALVLSGQAREWSFDFIIVSDELHDAADLRDHDELQAAVDAAKIDINQYFKFDPDEAARVKEEFDQLQQQVEESAPDLEPGEQGGCWLWLHDGISDLSRLLVASGRVKVSRNGRYLASLPKFSTDRDLRQRQDMTARLAELVRARFGVECSYFSVSGSFNPDREPFHAGEHSNRISFYNATWMYK